MQTMRTKTALVAEMAPGVVLCFALFRYFWFVVLCFIVGLFGFALLVGLIRT